MPKHILAVVVSVLCIGAAATPAQASLQSSTGASPRATISHLSGAANPYTPFCDNGSAGLCLRDPSDGGPGTLVKMSSSNGNASMSWATFLDSACGGIVGGPNGSEPNCPSEMLVDRYFGDQIVQIWNDGSNYCIGADADTNWVGEMKTCGFLNGEFIMSNSCALNGKCYTVSVDYSDYYGTIGWLCGSNTTDANPYVGACSPSDLAQWQ